MVVAVGLLLAASLLPGPRVASAGTPPAQVVPAMEAAYAGRSVPGVVATVVARQHAPATGLSVRAADARTARVEEAWADNGPAASRPFLTASVVKLFIAEDVLHRARSGRIGLGPEDVGLLRRMISSSDDPAASTLWLRYDGNRMVGAVARRYGLTGTAPPAVPGQWGLTVTTARDLARFLSLLPVVAHPDDAATLLSWMRAATPTAADGFDQRFGLFGAEIGAAAGAGDGAEDEVAVKQGWMCCVSGQRHVHSVGVVGRTVVVLLSEVPSEVGYDAARDALTAAAAPVPPSRRR